MSRKEWREPSLEKKEIHLSRSREMWTELKNFKTDFETANPGKYAFQDTSGRYMELLSAAMGHDNTCPECGSKDARAENYDAMWDEADIVCNGCDTYICGWDEG